MTLSNKIKSIYFVPGHPHILLAHDKSSKWKSLFESYKRVQKLLEKDNPDYILFYSTQWLSVIGHLIQDDPNPKLDHVDHNWHEYGTISYDFPVDTKFSKVCYEALKKDKHTAKLINYKGFPIDTGTLVAQKLLNPNNKFLASMVSCNIYADKTECQSIGESCQKAISDYNKTVSVVVVSSLSNRFFTHDINPEQDKISSAKDNEWNQKVLNLFENGSLDELSEIARDFAREGNADMGFKSIWWLQGLLGQKQKLNGNVFDYQPVWGTGAALIGLYPEKSLGPKEVSVKDTAQGTQSTNIISQEAADAVGPYPHAKKVGDLIFLSGIGPRCKSEKEIPGLNPHELKIADRYDIVTQTHHVIKNLKHILKASKSSLDKIIDIQVYLLDMKNHFHDFNRIYSEYFSKERGPTRTTIETSKLPTDIAVEFKVIAQQ